MKLNEGKRCSEVCGIKGGHCQNYWERGEKDRETTMDLKLPLAAI